MAEGAIGRRFRNRLPKESTASNSSPLAWLEAASQPRASPTSPRVRAPRPGSSPPRRDRPALGRSSNPKANGGQGDMHFGPAFGAWCRQLGEGSFQFGPRLAHIPTRSRAVPRRAAEFAGHFRSRRSLGDGDRLRQQCRLWTVGGDLPGTFGCFNEKFQRPFLLSCVESVVGQLIVVFFTVSPGARADPISNPAMERTPFGHAGSFRRQRHG